MDTQQRFRQAMMLRESGDNEGALRVLEEMRRNSSDPDESAAFLANQATCLLRMGRLMEAEKCLDDAEIITDTPWLFARLRENRAAIYWYAGKWKESLEVLEQVVNQFAAVLHSHQQRDLYELVQWRRGVLLSEFRRYGEAMPLLEEATSFNLRDDEKGLVHFELAVCLYKAGKLDASKKWFLKVISAECNPDKVVLSHYYLGAIDYSQGRFKEALQEFQWCESRSEDGRLPPQKLYAWLAKSYDALDMKEQARIYRILTNTQ